MRKITFLAGAGVGFVVGSKMGHGPYNKLESRISGLLGRQDVQDRLKEAANAAPGPLSDVAGKAVETLPNSRDGNAETPGQNALENSE